MRAQWRDPETRARMVEGLRARDVRTVTLIRQSLAECQRNGNPDRCRYHLHTRYGYPPSTPPESVEIPD